MNKKKLAYLMYNRWAEAMFGDRAARWEDLRQHEIDAWREAAEKIIPGIEYLQKDYRETMERINKIKAKKRSAA